MKNFIIIEKKTINNKLLKSAKNGKKAEPITIYTDDDGFIPSDYCYFEIDDIYNDDFAEYVKYSSSDVVTVINDVVTGVDVINKNSDVVRVSSLAFASKILEDGSRIFRRKYGQVVSIAANASIEVPFTIPYAKCKIDKVEIVGASSLDKLDFKIIDTATGTYSGTPNAVLDQFGFNVAVAAGFYSDTSNYDADLYQGMIIGITYKNAANQGVNVGFNYVLHEVVTP